MEDLLRAGHEAHLGRRAGLLPLEAELRTLARGRVRVVREGAPLLPQPGDATRSSGTSSVPSCDLGLIALMGTKNSHKNASGIIMYILYINNVCNVYTVL